MITGVVLTWSLTNVADHLTVVSKTELQSDCLFYTRMHARMHAQTSHITCWLEKTCQALFNLLTICPLTWPGLRKKHNFKIQLPAPLTGTCRDRHYEFQRSGYHTAKNDK